jgi:selenoprotein W-related protein
MSGLSNPLQIEKHRVTIRYCVPCDYSEYALEIAQELIRSYQHVIGELVFEMSSGGVLEVKVDDELLFSKETFKRYPKRGEVLKLFGEFVGTEVPVYPHG